jgi:RHS repeat-associated protein
MRDWLNYARPTPIGSTAFVHRTFSYDDQGNGLYQTLSSGSAWLSYNDRNQFTGIGYGTSITLGYGGPNQAELIADGGRTVENNLLGKGRRIDGTQATAFIRAADGTLLARKAPGNVWSYYVLDNLGSVIGVTDATGALTKSYDYDPDGNPWPENWDDRPEDFGYAGAYAQYGGQTLYHNGLRWYDPETARWTQADPLDQPADLQDANRYRYVGSNPINYVDPTGSLSCSTIGLGGACKAAKGVAKTVTKKVVAANGLVCYVKKSVASNDTNRLSDDLGDAVNCLNPVSGYTGDVGGTDD